MWSSLRHMILKSWRGWNSFLMLNYDFQVVSPLYYDSLKFSFQIRSFKHPFFTGGHEVISFLKDVHRKQGSSFLMQPLCIDFIYIKCASRVFEIAFSPVIFFLILKANVQNLTTKIQTHWTCKWCYIDLLIWFVGEMTD